MWDLLMVLFQVILIVLVADLAGGCVHWFEDAYATEDLPILGEMVAKPNIIHHHFPGHMAHKNWWQTSWDLVLLSGLALFVAWGLGLLCWQVWLFAILAANMNEFHKWTHRSRVENGPFISRLQDWGLLQDAKHHAMHHSGRKDTRYCVTTPFLNPWLDRIRFWERLEKTLERALGWEHRKDTSLPGQGPPPTWLLEYATSLRLERDGRPL
jgi:plasmanylethanolamine desaturase